MIDFLKGDVTVSASINYHLLTDLRIDYPGIESASAYAIASLFFGKYLGDLEVEAILEHDTASGETGSEEFGTLSLSHTFGAGDILYIDLYAEVMAGARGAVPAPAPVPEPATMLLLGSGLAGLVGFRRKFRSG